jgi:O-antigen/teichoic acid export membrane protein
MSFALGRYERIKSRFAGQVGRFRYGISALDQIALSLFAFSLNLVLVRVLTPTDFGIVALWTAIGLLAASIQNALVGTPLNVHVQGAPDAASGRHLAEALAVVNLLTIVVVTVAVVLVDLLSDAEWAPRYLATALAIPLFVAAGMYRTYYRGLAFSRRDMIMLLWVDGPYLVVTTLCLGLMFAWPEKLAGLAFAFFAMSVGCLASQPFMTGRFRGPALRTFSRFWLVEYRRVIGDTGWALVGVITAHLQSYSYLYVADNMVGLAGMATINVVGILFRPVRVMVTAWGRAALPELAGHIAAGRIAAVDRIVVRAFLAAGAGSVLWFILLWFGWGEIDRRFLVGHYPEARLLLWPWALAAMLDGVSATLSIALQAAREFRYLAYVTIIGAPVTIAATAGAIVWHGYTWAMYGVALGYFVVVALLIVRYWQVRRNFRAASRPAEAIAAEPAPSIGP